MDRPPRLTREFVEQVKRLGRYGDGRGGNGLSLRVGDHLKKDTPRAGRSIGKTWEQRIYVRGNITTMGLGSYPAMKLTAAREAAAANVQRIKAATPRVSVLDRLLADPDLAPAAVGASDVPTFAEAFEDHMTAQRVAWKPGSKTERLERGIVNNYAMPALGAIPVDRITSDDVLGVLEPIWHTKGPTAAKLRRMLKAVFDRARARGHRDDNPIERADLGLKRQNNVTKHAGAVPYEQVPEAMAYIEAARTYEAKKRAFRFLILTAARTGEVLGMRRDEVKVDEYGGRGTWTIPGGRMKAGREHRVPLSMEAMMELNVAGLRDGDDPDELLFVDGGKQLNPDALRVLLKRRYPEATPHGFRSSFRDWVSERTDYPSEIAEHALAHLETSATVRAYARSDMFDKRRQLMDDWAAYARWHDTAHPNGTSR